VARAFKGEVIIFLIRLDDKELRGRSLSVANSDIFIFFIIFNNIPSLRILLRSELLSVFLNN
jgi:hypothetical protein